MTATKVLIFAANSAIAEAFARLLAPTGADFFLVARRQEKLETLSADLRVRGASKVRVEPQDLDLVDAFPALLAKIDDWGQPTIVLLAQGSLGVQSECEQDLAAAQRVLHNNFLAPALLLTEIGKRMEQQGSGSLLVISSVAADRGRKSNYVYGSAKSGLATFCEGLHHRLKAAGVRVVCIKPGFVDTPMTTHLPKNPLFASPDQIARGMVRALKGQGTVRYLPFFWAPIMFLIRNIPDRIFSKLSL